VGPLRRAPSPITQKSSNCLFTRVASQNLALVNGRNIVFEGNRFLSPGQSGGPGSTNIDLEPNEPGDRLENVVIRRNFIGCARLRDAHNRQLASSGASDHRYNSRGPNHD